MPFKNASDPNLPANVKKLSATKRSTWVSTFNSTFSSCQSKGGSDCEAISFKVANSTVKEDDSMKKNKFLKINDYFSTEISEASFDKDGKKELVVTLLKEGPGNRFHMNYYTRRALESASQAVMSRPKQYFNHAKDIDNPDRDLRDWASSIIETWVDTTEPKAKLKARVKVLDDWLWERAKVAPAELAVSIEGKGAGRPQTIEGESYNAIYEIQRVNGVNWVDYPGNAGLGVQVLEKDENHSGDENELDDEHKEDKNMLKDVLESMKDLTKEELKELAISKPELKEFFFLPPKEDEKTKKDMGELKESMQTLSEKVSSLQKEKVELSNKVEAHEIKEKANDKEKLVDKLLGESKLKDKQITETFKNQLSITEKEEDVKKLIEDREKICVVEKADPSQDGAGSGGSEITEKEKSKEFVSNLFGETIEDEDIEKAIQ